MRKGLLIVGIVVLIIGAGLFALAFSGTTSSQAIASGSCYGLSVPSTIGSAPVTFSWSGGSSTTTVSLLAGGSSCDSGAVVASGNGASGSFSSTLTPGTIYPVTVTGTGVTVTLTDHGLTLLELIGIIVLILGVLIAVLAVVRKPKMHAAPMMAGDEHAPAADAGSDVYTAGPAAAGFAPGARANQVCTHCGTTNEAWLTNCRNCKRPLASTSG